MNNNIKILDEKSKHKFSSPCPPPDGYAAEILIVLDEELHEIGEAACNSLLLATHVKSEAEVDSWHRLFALEIGDFFETLDRAINANVLRRTDVEESALRKLTEYKAGLVVFDGHTLIRVAKDTHLAGQRICKALRFGLAEIQPGQPDDNARRVGLTAGYLKGMFRILADEGLIKQQDIDEGIERKRRQLDRFLQNDPLIYSPI